MQYTMQKVNSRNRDHRKKGRATQTIPEIIVIVIVTHNQPEKQTKHNYK